MASVRPAGASAWSTPVPLDGVLENGDGLGIDATGRMWVATTDVVEDRAQRIEIVDPTGASSDIPLGTAVPGTSPLVLDLAPDGTGHVVQVRRSITASGPALPCTTTTQVMHAAVSAGATSVSFEPAAEAQAQGELDGSSSCVVDSGELLFNPIVTTSTRNTTVIGYTRSTEQSGTFVPSVEAVRSLATSGFGAPESIGTTAEFPFGLVPLGDTVALFHQAQNTGAGSVSVASDTGWDTQPVFGSGGGQAVAGGPGGAVVAWPAGVNEVGVRGIAPDGTLDRGVTVPGGDYIDVGVDARGNGVVGFRASGGGSPQPSALVPYDVSGPSLVGRSVPARVVQGKPFTVRATARDVWSASGPVRWRFGSGPLRTGGTLTHTFTKPGAQSVSTTVTDALGNTTVVTSTVQVLADKVKPKVRALKVAPKRPTPTERAAITFRTNEAGSVSVVLRAAVGGRVVTKRAAAVVRRSGAVHVTLPKLPSARWTATVSMRDGAGNVAKKTVKFSVGRG